MFLPGPPITAPVMALQQCLPGRTEAALRDQADQPTEPEDLTDPCVHACCKTFSCEYMVVSKPGMAARFEINLLQSEQLFAFTAWRGSHPETMCSRTQCSNPTHVPARHMRGPTESCQAGPGCLRWKWRIQGP